jgi:hypothetical protein
MVNPETDREKYLAARAHVAAIKGFYIHLIVFAAVMAGLFAIDALSGGSWWIQYPLIGWGIGILGHAYLAFRPIKPSEGSWEDRKIKETIAKMQ